MKRRILMLTPAAFSTVRQAMQYVHDSFTGEGDISGRWWAANDRVLVHVDAAPTVHVNATRKALVSIMNAAIDNSCSCPGPDSATGIDHSGPLHKASGHARDCFVASHHVELERVRELIKLFKS